MPIRLRLTILFAALAMIILCLVCGGVYYFSYQARKDNIKRRLTNRAITTARLLEQKETFDRSLVQKIDSLTTIALTEKVVLAYNSRNQAIYRYSDIGGDSVAINDKILEDTRRNGTIFFEYGDKEIVAYYYNGISADIVVVSAAEDTGGKKGLTSLLNILLLSFFLGNIFVIAGGFIFSGRLLKPIKKITEDVEEISAQNLARRIETGAAHDEWAHLANTLNNLLNRLQESFEFQKRFISNASHELSTPLTSICSQLEVTLQRERTGEEYKQVIQSVYQDVIHMSKLTQTLLEFAKAAGSASGLEINLVRMDEVILRLPAELSFVNKQYKVSVEFGNLPADEAELLVFGNEILLLMAIKNIIINSCKYSDDHAARVTLKVEDKSVVIFVTDCGRGIPASELGNIFQPFYRVKQDTDQQGFGLGLSLASKIIVMHKGTVDVVSEINQGTEFKILLPNARAFV